VLLLLQVINNKLYKTREQFDAAVDEELVKSQIDLVCLAGFMRIVSGSSFVLHSRGL
jgi:phosphoribosylamine--glycine ligase/phosphoribosylglycinamide formyltransferase/phosphoribosylformylglycinamidine cyclo-ligase